MIDGKEIKVLDKNAEYHGVPTSTLMENAGKGLAEYVIKLKPKVDEILIFCGTGNNGGDGFVSARYLSKNYKITVFLVGKENNITTVISKNNFKKIKKMKIKIYDVGSLKLVGKLLLKNSLIIDSMLGVGLTGSLREPYLTLVKKINSIKNKTIISVDVPTGLGCGIAIKPNYTVTFHDIKEGMNEKNSGKIKIVDIGIPKKAVEYVGPGELVTYYPIPKEDSHKGDNGRVLVIGGGPYIGAPAMSGLASLRTGSDLAFIVTPKKAARAITSFSPLLVTPERLAKETAKLSPNLIVRELSQEDKLVLEDVEVIEDYIPKIDTVILGPGLGSDKSTKDAVEKIIQRCVSCKKSMVIDADAIQVVGKKPELVKYTRTVVTPHAGEFRDLTNVKLDGDLAHRKKKVEEWAKKLEMTILLKGPVDIVSDGQKTKFNDIHNRAMTIGGTGDVLAGIVGSLLSKGVEPFNAARMGAFLNGSAGNAAFGKKSYGLIATDIIEEIPHILKKYL